MLGSKGRRDDIKLVARKKAEPAARANGGAAHLHGSSLTLGKRNTMLRETPTSLRAYFGLITIFALMPVIGQITSGKIEYVSLGISLVFGGIYGFVAVRMDRLLSERPGVVRGVLIMNLSLAGLSSLFAALNGRIWGSLPYLAIAFAITAYLLSSVGRLSAEASLLKKKEPNQPAQTTPGS